MLQFDPLYYPHKSQRTMVFAQNGMVATSQPLAAEAGLSVLRQGGNAIDAAVATAATLTVLEPTSNGIGGDAFALVWTGGKLYGLNSSGPAPRRLTIEEVERRGHSEMPRWGWLPVTVPGVPAAWNALSERFGSLPLETNLSPAITYAGEGYPVSPTTGYYWQRAFDIYKQNLKGPEFEPWFEVFAPEGKPPGIGEVFSSKGHAKTLESIAKTGARSFYQGDLAEKIVNFAAKTGGLIAREDLEAFVPEWVEPIKVNYRGFDVWEIPPNGQGIVALMALNILSLYDDLEFGTPLTYHRQIEAVKLAFSDAKACVTDQRFRKVDVEGLLSLDYARSRMKLIGSSALLPKPGMLPQSGTVYLATADRYGNMVSYIQSNYMGFGSGIVVPGTGIALQNRGHTFSLDRTHVNCLEPGKRTYHTIIPGFMTKGGEPVGPFGVMGAFMQPQGHVQVVMNAVGFGLNPQAALDAPRFQWLEGKTVELESTMPDSVREKLSRMGHDVRTPVTSGSFGRGQIIWRMPNGTLAGGTEPRTDGTIAAY